MKLTLIIAIILLLATALIAPAAPQAKALASSRDQQIAQAAEG